MVNAEHRSLHFENLAESLREAERLANGDVRTTGHFTLGQILEHLARSIDITTGQMPPPPFPAVMAWGAKIMFKLLKKKFIYSPAKPGFKLPSKSQNYFWPSDDVPVADGLEHLKRSCEQLMKMQQIPPHPIFGQLSAEETIQFQCRHFELHLGFVHPK